MRYIGQAWQQSQTLRRKPKGKAKLGVSFSVCATFANYAPITSIEILSKVGMPDILQGSRQLHHPNELTWQV